MGMSVARNLIEQALNEIASDEGGMRFQGLAVVLGKLRWPELVACERKNDLGLDAYAPASISSLHVGIGLSSSITSALDKIKKDADRAKPHFPDLQILAFITPGKVTNDAAKDWQSEIKKTYGWELIIMSREEIIATLQVPDNASLCQTHLGIAIPESKPTTKALLELTLEAANDVIASWSRRTDQKTVIDLRLSRLDEKGSQTQETYQLQGISDLLLKSKRIVLEGPAGRGKTTTLIQLARAHRAQKRVACLVDLPAWVRSGLRIFDFIAGMEEFQSRGLTAEDLARVNRAQPFTFLLNGWNELNASESTEGASSIRDLERSFAKGGIAVATRAHPVAPPLPGSVRFRLQPLTGMEREVYLTTRLKDRAGELNSLLNNDPVLNDLTTTPMILAEVVSLFEAGKPIPASKLGVLDAVTRLMEDSAEHQAALAGAPLFGMARRYLEGLGSWLVASGGVLVSEPQARAIISSAWQKLHDSGQAGTAPEPGIILTALCSDHVLDRATYPEVSYTFSHQQFQELFAALRLMRMLAALTTTGDGRAELAAEYINEPAWSEPLYMLAEFIDRHTPDEPLPRAAAMGKQLIDITLPIDPIFAAELAYLCGPAVWALVRGQVGERLRQLYSSQSSINQNIGLAGMVASGSEDFSDVIVPLLSSVHPGTHVDPYRAPRGFHISSLGRDWKQLVRQWNENARVAFVSEMLGDAAIRSEVLSFALADPSPGVRESVLERSWRTMSPEEALRFSETLDDSQFAKLMQSVPANNYVQHYVQPSIRGRAVATLRRIAMDAADGARFMWWAWELSACLGDSDAIEQLKKQLSSMTAEQISKLHPAGLRSVVELIHHSDSAWVGAWVTNGLLAGVLEAETYLHMVTGISAFLRDELLDRVTTKDLMENRIPGVYPLLRAFGDDTTVKRLFQRACDLHSVVMTSRPGDDKQSERKLAEQIIDLLRDMTPNLVVGNILRALDRTSVPVEVEVICEIFNRAGRNASSLREMLTEEMRHELRSYLKSATPIVLTLDDPYGQTKAYFATVLAQVGNASDLDTMEQLIKADIERMRVEMAARTGAPIGPAQGTGRQ